MPSNEEQVAFWNGTAATRWVQGQVRMDRTLRPLGLAALEAAELAPGHRVLDVGCGCGDTTFELARRVGPQGRVIGVDVSAQMLAHARARAAEVGVEATCHEADAASAPLPTVDRIFSRFGVMFFDEPEAAFANLRSALVSGGRLSFVCWRGLGANAWARLPFEAVNAVLGPPPGPPDPHAPGPFAFAEPERVTRILSGAGFSDVALSPLDLELEWAESVDDATLRDAFVNLGPAARRLYDAPEDVREAAAEAILGQLRPHAREGRLALASAVWVVSARA